MGGGGSKEFGMVKETGLDARGEERGWGGGGGGQRVRAERGQNIRALLGTAL